MATTTKTPAMASLKRIEELAGELVTETVVFSHHFRNAVHRDGVSPEGVSYVDAAYQAGQAALQLLISASIMNTEPWLSADMTEKVQGILRGAVEGRGHETSRALALLMLSHFDELSALAAQFDATGGPQ